MSGVSCLRLLPDCRDVEASPPSRKNALINGLCARPVIAAESKIRFRGKARPTKYPNSPNTMHNSTITHDNHNCCCGSSKTVKHDKQQNVGPSNETTSADEVYDSFTIQSFQISAVLSAIAAKKLPET